ncbi:MAG TPA: orotidine 5'-phosphate decarboxylase / HUMPS family protein [Roseiarcus sp.]|jgi:3-hexulose-6-phosphate synthase|nr:orotidine 5'-phosphate decarboxylase / HUMPS family protein [Roseiarcus sp.]
MLLQVAIDKPEHLGVLPLVCGVADIVEIGTPLLKCFGIGAIATARALCPDTPVLADTKTVDAGDVEAEMVFGAGARLMTVLSSTSPATHAAVDRVAARFGALVVVDTITESEPELLPTDAVFPHSFAYVGVHSPTDARLAGESSAAHIKAVGQMHRRGYRVALAGGLGPLTLDAVLEAEPEIVIVGSAITSADDPKGVARWIRDRLRNPGRGWPSDAR